MTVSPLEGWFAIIGLMLMVVALRAVFLFVPDRWRPRGAFERALRYGPLAALVAIAAPQLLEPVLVAAPTFASLWDDRRVPAALALLVVGRLTGNPFAGLAAGGLVLAV